MTNHSKKVIAIVVTYNPDPNLLHRLLDATASQVHSIIFIDNASKQNPFDSVFLKDRKNITTIRLEENFGLSYAQNIGLKKAIDIEAEYALLLDQDSVPTKHMVSELLQYPLKNPTELIAAIGPATRDPRTGNTSLFMAERFGLPHRIRKQNLKSKDNSSNFIQARFLISSGSLIPLAIIREIGGLRSDFFIDHVDTEWCFRAQAAGYKLIGLPNTILEHRLGDKVTHFWFLHNRQIMHHSPLRDYYMFRNTILMIRHTRMSTQWKIFFLFRLFQFSAFFLLFTNSKHHRLKTIFLGLRHGLSNQSGRLDPDTACLHQIKNEI